MRSGYTPTYVACANCGNLARVRPSAMRKYCSLACAYAHRTQDLAARFWPKVKKSGSGCWLWSASRANGYGQIGSGGHDGRPFGAHRVSWELHFGPIPDGLDVCHTCDT